MQGCCFGPRSDRSRALFHQELLAPKLESLYSFAGKEHVPIARGQLSWRSDLRDDVSGSCSSGSECCLLRLVVADEDTLPALFDAAAVRFGLYEQSCGCSRLTQFSHGCLLSHFTLRWRHGQQAVPGSIILSQTKSNKNYRGFWRNGKARTSRYQTQSGSLP